jgi:tetratricopeptide (TPR) repeat protein
MSNPFRSAIFFCLLLPGIAAAQDQAGQDASSCRAVIDAADKLMQSENKEDWKESLSRYDQAVTCLRPAHAQLWAHTLVKISRTMLLLNQQSKMMARLKPELDALQQLNDQNTEVLKDQAKVWGNLGHAQQTLGHMEEALSNYKEVLKAFERLGDLPQQAVTCENIGLVLSLEGRYKDSLSSYEQALNLREKIDPKDIKNQQQIAATFDLRGRVYAQMNDSDKAMADYQRALPLAEQTKYDQFVAYTLNDIGALWLKRNWRRRAQRYHQKALYIQQHQQHKADEKDIVETLALLADVETAQAAQASDAETA